MHVPAHTHVPAGEGVGALIRAFMRVGLYTGMLFNTNGQRLGLPKDAGAAAVHETQLHLVNQRSLANPRLALLL